MTDDRASSRLTHQFVLDPVLPLSNEGEVDPSLESSITRLTTGSDHPPHFVGLWRSLRALFRSQNPTIACLNEEDRSAPIDIVFVGISGNR